MSGWFEKSSYARAAGMMASSRKPRGEGMDAAGGQGLVRLHESWREQTAREAQEIAFVLGLTAQKSAHTGTANNQNTVSK
jgi:GrpB-like predicted nucleotidyltransferase (UPF0157 family)